ncbi:MAG: sensor histidine kinase [Anaerolineaceae bacterium]|nr:sensor histidine kinase [Anaerolineaceae bacterium]
MDNQKSFEDTRLLRTAAWIWISYLVALLGIDMIIYARRFGPMVMAYHVFNLLPALGFLGLSYTEEIQKRTRFVTNAMILLITVVPILVNHMYDLKLPPAPLSNLEGLAIRQLPVLIIGLVLVAWYFKLPGMIFFALGVSLLEIVIVLLFKGLHDPRLPVFILIILIRMVCFLVVGVFINQLIQSLRRQQASLQAANEKLNHYASTLENLTITRERNRMSRELHDTAVHTLSGLAVQLETADAYMDVQPETAKQLITQSLQAVRNGLNETRRALKALRASPLEDLGLKLALQNLLHSAAERGKLKVYSTLPERIMLSPDLEQAVFRIAQEAVENIVHHANAKQINFSLVMQDQALDLIIEDDGIGFLTKQNKPAGHYGLTGMQERAHLIGGSIEIDSQPGQGCEIHFNLPGAVQ